MATDLLILRDQIDTIDKQIVELYEKRMEVCKEVAEYKIVTGKKVLDKVREAEKIEKVKSMASTEFRKYAVQELFEQIMSISRKMQYQLLAEHGCIGNLPFMSSENLYNKQASVVFQGAEGAYSQAAMNQFFGKNIKSFHVDTFRDAMIAIEEGRADFAVLPIENSTACIVNEIYDLLT